MNIEIISTTVQTQTRLARFSFGFEFNGGKTCLRRSFTIVPWLKFYIKANTITIRLSTSVHMRPRVVVLIAACGTRGSRIQIFDRRREAHWRLFKDWKVHWSHCSRQCVVYPSSSHFHHCLSSVVASPLFWDSGERNDGYAKMVILDAIVAVRSSMWKSSENCSFIFEERLCLKSWD